MDKKKRNSFLPFFTRALAPSTQHGGAAPPPPPPPPDPPLDPRMLVTLRCRLDWTVLTFCFRGGFFFCGLVYQV